MPQPDAAVPRRFSAAPHPIPRRSHSGTSAAARASDRPLLRALEAAAALDRRRPAPATGGRRVVALAAPRG